MADETTIQTGEDLFAPLMDELLSLDYGDRGAIIVTEQKIYNALQFNPAQIEGMITLMFAQTMLGNRDKAKALAHKIWEVGGELPQFFELIFISCLLNTGLLEMAAVLLKPRFEKLIENVSYFYPVLVKFALMTGNIALFRRLEAFPDSDDDRILFELADVYEEGKFIDQFKNIQKLVLENTTNSLCAYEYNLFEDREIPEIEIELYLNQDAAACDKIENALESKIKAYWQSTGNEPLNNYAVRVMNISLHEAWDEEEELSDTPPTSAEEDEWSAKAAEWGQTPRN